MKVSSVDPLVVGAAIDRHVGQLDATARRIAGLVESLRGDQCDGRQEPADRELFIQLCENEAPPSDQ